MFRAIFIILLVIVVLSLLVAIGSSKPQSIEVVVLEDITSKTSRNQLSMQQLSLLFEHEQYPWRQVKFRHRYISDILYDRSSEITLPQASQTLSNSYERKTDIAAFYSDMQHLLEPSNQAKGREQSIIYQVISQELTRLVKQPSDQKVLIILSDLMEHNDAFSVYAEHLEPRIETKMQQLFKQHPIPDLTGITVYLLHNPEGFAEGGGYDHLVRLYQKHFAEKGAKVFINASVGSPNS